MSGGVDSAVAALLLRDQDYECAGAVMKLRGNDGAVGEARAAARSLGFPFHVFDLSGAFQSGVVAPFIGAYRAGRTPNPCVDCNRLLKFGHFVRLAGELGYPSVATGHYARVERDGGRLWLKKGLDPSKDQSYVLYSLTQQQLARAFFPLGGLMKSQVLEIAAERGVPAARKGESQDICFVPDGDYAGFIERAAGEAFPSGRFVDANGNTLGEHRGIVRYTVGQRRGLGLAHSEPLYVKEIHPEDNTVVVGTADTLFSRTLTLQDVNLIALDRLDATLRAKVKIRYRHAEQPAVITPLGSAALRVDFDEPQRAVTPGQAAVIYDGDVVVGGGTILETKE